MPWHDGDLVRGLDVLRNEVASALAGPALVTADGFLLMDAQQVFVSSNNEGPSPDDRDLATSSEESEADRTRLIALVELARKGDADAFGLLYDHYSGAV